MKTLTLTEAKRNLEAWLKAAARGEDIRIRSGRDIIALQKVDLTSADYARREYGVTETQLAAFEKAEEARYRRMKKAGKLVTVDSRDLKKLLE